MTNEQIKLAIGQAYLTGTGFEEETPFVKAAYREISKVNQQLFDKMNVNILFTDKDFYASAKDMRDSYDLTNVLYIYDGWSGHPFLTQHQNNIGRAVHDVYAHLVCGCPFSFEGEYTAYLEQRKHYPQWTWDVLFAEIVGQTCAYYASLCTHDFRQRAMEAPKAWIKLANNLVLPDFSKNGRSLQQLQNQE